LTDQLSWFAYPYSTVFCFIFIYRGFWSLPDYNRSTAVFRQTVAFTVFLASYHASDCKAMYDVPKLICDFHRIRVLIIF